MNIVTIASLLVVLVTLPVVFVIPAMTMATIIASRRAANALKEHRRLERAIAFEVYESRYPVDIRRAHDKPRSQ